MKNHVQRIQMGAMRNQISTVRKNLIKQKVSHLLECFIFPAMNLIVFTFFGNVEIDFGDQADDLSMFSVEESDNKDVYPDIDSTMDVFSTDALQQRTRENNCNYDWDDIDVMNVLQSVSDWPVTLQVQFTNEKN